MGFVVFMFMIVVGVAIWSYCDEVKRKKEARKRTGGKKPYRPRRRMNFIDDDLGFMMLEHELDDNNSRDYFDEYTSRTGKEHPLDSLRSASRDRLSESELIDAAMWQDAWNDAYLGSELDDVRDDCEYDGLYDDL